MLAKKPLKILSLALVSLLCLAGVLLSNNSSSSVSFRNNQPTVSPQQQIGEIEGVSVSSSPQQNQVDDSSLPSSEETSFPREEGAQTYQVMKVVDGDTMDINIDGQVSRLRVIGIDTPETVDPRKSVQCFGIEASNKAKEILTGQYVTVESDPTQGDKDKYGRLLRYVYLPDGTDYGLFMISNGYAHEYTYNIPYEKQSDYRKAEADARNNDRGLWSPSTCNGNK